MYFNNPQILQGDTDIIIGAVNCGDRKEITFLNYMNLVSQNLEYHIEVYIENLKGKDVSRERALKLTADRIYNTLEGYYVKYPTNEQELTEYLMETRYFEMWASDILIRFKNTHKGKVTMETKIPSVVDNGIEESEIKEVLSEVDFLTILQKLSMYADIGNPTVDWITNG